MLEYVPYILSSISVLATISFAVLNVILMFRNRGQDKEQARMTASFARIEASIASLTKTVEKLRDDMHDTVTEIRREIVQGDNAVREGARRDRHNSMNRADAKISDVDRKVDTLSQDVASMKGRLDVARSTKQ